MSHETPRFHHRSGWIPGRVAARGGCATRAVPVIGFLGGQAPDHVLLANFHQGLNAWGFFEGRNVAIEYRWALDQSQRLPDLAAELVRQHVALIVTAGGLAAAKAAKDATRRFPFSSSAVWTRWRTAF